MKTARPGLPRFDGPFKSFSVSVSSNREKGTDDRLLVYSQGSRAKVNNFLWLKYLWDELSREEFRLFLALPENLNSEMKVATLRAALLLSKREIRERLNKILILLNEKPFLREHYQGYKRLDVEIKEITRNLPRVPKFSGWVRSSSKVGTKRGYQGPSYLDPLAIYEGEYDDNYFDWYTCLTVGDLNLNSLWDF